MARFRDRGGMDVAAAVADIVAGMSLLTYTGVPAGHRDRSVAEIKDAGLPDEVTARLLDRLDTIVATGTEPRDDLVYTSHGAVPRWLFGGQ